ncbi:hypothetical protein N7516_003625 [Penicillium verrucosum]|uniref:uncharacterized protein n=1 Tax=Penicillium verrucosum TaxID=60171 RepID=UPI0025457599|nr:uncharacterized protein N7516_003625 [Penicillium verrucosum]KAJ5943457.1 hypothetical protein N7516_003625 [Penicillium verrucosum]
MALVSVLLSTYLADLVTAGFSGADELLDPPKLLADGVERVQKRLTDQETSIEDIQRELEAL